MGIFKKMEDVLRANLNDLLDKATDPIKQLNLMVEDMRDFRVKQVENIGKAVASLKMVEADLTEAKASVERWAKRAKRAADASNNEDAKMALKQQIQQEKLVATLEMALQDGKQNVERLKMELARLDEKVEWLESQRSVIEVRVRTAKARKDMHGPISKHGEPVRTDEVLGRVDAKVKKMEAEAGAAEEVAGLAKPKKAEDHFREEELDEEVEKRLAELKAQK